LLLLSGGLILGVFLLASVESDRPETSAAFLSMLDGKVAPCSREEIRREAHRKGWCVSLCFLSKDTTLKQMKHLLSSPLMIFIHVSFSLPLSLSLSLPLSLSPPLSLPLSLSPSLSLSDVHIFALVG
jgi:hypothetical protein